jgi:hypothetical protein
LCIACWVKPDVHEGRTLGPKGTQAQGARNVSHDSVLRHPLPCELSISSTPYGIQTGAARRGAEDRMSEVALRGLRLRSGLSCGVGRQVLMASSAGADVLRQVAHCKHN